MSIHPVTRRALLRSSGMLIAWAFVPRLASAAGARDPRFVAVVLRGALDGLALAAPVGDPDYERVRNGLVVPASRRFTLDGFFALNPNMPVLGSLFQKGEALVVHAVATAYRERSHFDGQDVLESGQPGPGLVDSGWLNRALETLPKGDRLANRDMLALGPDIPLIVRGAAPVVTLMPEDLPAPDDDTRARLLDLYRHTNPMLAARFEQALTLRAKLQASDGARGGIQPAAAGVPAQVRIFRFAGETTGSLLARDDGPRIGAVSLNGWDTHQDEGLIDGRLGKLLAALDQTIDGLRRSLAAAWSDTVIAITTEFGRTARMNGTTGTDHGTATVAVLVGGAVRGGRVIADWPGLSAQALYQNRDLKPTTDLRAVLKGLLRDHVGVPDQALADVVFPGTEQLKPIDGLVA
jgi:uncharacterized protein (DUF1501 family)